jgi:hypothetical protein
VTPKVERTWRQPRSEGPSRVQRAGECGVRVHGEKPRDCVEAVGQLRGLSKCSQPLARPNPLAGRTPGGVVGSLRWD